MTAVPSRLVCAGCGAEPRPAEPWPFRCPRAGEDGTEHVLVKRLDPAAIGSPEFWREVFRREEPNPFLRFRELFHSYHVALAAGLRDEDWTEIVAELDEQVRAVDGRGFRATPLLRADRLAAELGAAPGSVLVKDETGNVAGSHKARHLAAVLLWREVAGRIGLVPEDDAPRLAIASCGNAALAAAVLARAAELPLDVFVPTHASREVLLRLHELGAHVVTCPRREGERGDPCVHRFREAVARRRALPFTCQGPENGLVIEGGETLAYEVVAERVREEAGLDAVFVQVGGGALASSCAQAFARVVRMGVLPRLPRIHAVQTAGGAPLARAWDRFVARFGRPEGPALDAALAEAARRRGDFMTPWEREPESLASGILDDETYDWLAVVDGLARSGGAAVVAAEELVVRAYELGRRATGLPVCPTGTAGLAGYLACAATHPADADRAALLLFTGHEREAEPGV